MNSYHAIAISNADTKILEKLLLPCITSHAHCDHYQSGFKASRSTTLCADVLRQTLDYFVTRVSCVFVSFVDVSKASIPLIVGSFSISCWMMGSSPLD